MKINFEVSRLIKASQQQIYYAWLDSESHSAMTGGEAEVSNKAGESFQAWDGYIQGKNIELLPAEKIVQRWRTSEFEDSDEDSLLEIRLEVHPEGTLIRLLHSNLPGHGMQYKQGWVDNYFIPMEEYFSGIL